MRILKLAAALGCIGMAASVHGAAHAGATDPQTGGKSSAVIPAQDSDALPAPRFELATGVDYSAGHYGAAADTTVWSIPIDAKAQLGRLRLQASLPYEFINGPGQMVGGVIVSSSSGTATTRRSGLGDLALTGAYMVVRESGILPSLELGGSVKLPTAPTYIGTGQTDYTLSANLYKTLVPGVMLFGSAGYSWLGSPAVYQLRNGVMASAGLNFRPSPKANYGLSLAYRDPVVTGLPGQAIVSPYMTYRIGRGLGITAYAMGGLNRASPRVGAGLRLSLMR